MRPVDGLLRGYARHFGAGRCGVWYSQSQRRDDRRNRREAGERIKAAGKTAAIVFRPTHGRGPEEAAEIADPVDSGNAGSRRSAGQETLVRSVDVVAGHLGFANLLGKDAHAH